MIANSLVSNSLDYWDSILFDVDGKLLKQLQRVQNTLARVVCCASRFCYVAAPFHSMCWVKNKYGIALKINTLIQNIG